MRTCRYLRALAVVCLTGCATRSTYWDRFPEAPRRAWREHQSYYALRELVDLEFHPGSTKADVLRILGTQASVECPGAGTNALAFRSRGWQCNVDLLITFDANGGMETLEWLEPSPPWGKIALPYVPFDGCTSICHDFPILIDKSGALFLRGVRMQAELTEKLISARYNRIGEFSVLIGADAETPFRQVWPTVALCFRSGLWRLSFAAFSRRDGKAYGALEFNVLAREDYPDHKGGLLRITVLRNQYQLQDERKPQTPDETEAELFKLGRVDRDLPVFIVPGQDALHSDVVSLMGFCRKAGLRNVSLVDNF